MLIIYLQICEVNYEHYKSRANLNIFLLKLNRGMNSSSVIFFSSTLLKKIIYIYIYVRTQARIYIGPWALSEEEQWFENRSTTRKT